VEVNIRAPTREDTASLLPGRLSFSASRKRRQASAGTLSPGFEQVFSAENFVRQHSPIGRGESS